MSVLWANVFHRNSRRPELLEASKVEASGYPEAMMAREIMVGAAVLERQFDVAPYESRSMVRPILAAIRSRD